MTSPRDAAPGPGDDALARWQAARDRAEVEREATLVSDGDRERVCELLAAAFSEGRLTPEELDERTTRALAARTTGDLEDVLDGLARPDRPALWAPRRPGGLLPRVLFWLVGVLTSPLVFVGGMLVLFGNDLGDRAWGVVLLVLFLPGVIALYRWAHPRT